MSLVPLERMQSRLDERDEAALYIIVYAEVAFDQISKIFHDLIGILFQESLKSAE
jgi:hypothetical protein